MMYPAKSNHVFERTEHDRGFGDHPMHLSAAKNARSYLERSCMKSNIAVNG